MKRYVAAAALAGWVGLAIQQYLIFYSRWDAGASLLGGLINFFSFFKKIIIFGHYHSFS